MPGVTRAKINNRSGQIPPLLHRRQCELFRMNGGISEIMERPGLVHRRKAELAQLMNDSETTSLDILLICDAIAKQSNLRYQEIKEPHMVSILEEIEPNKLTEAKTLVEESEIPLDPKLTHWLKRAGKPAVAFIVPSSEQTKRKEYVQPQVLNKVRHVPSVKQPQHPFLPTLSPPQRRVIELHLGIDPNYPGRKMITR